MKLIDFDSTDKSLSRVTVITDPPMDEEVFKEVKLGLTQLQLGHTVEHNGSNMIITKSALYRNKPQMDALKKIMRDCYRTISEKRAVDEERRVAGLNDLRLYADLENKMVRTGPGA